MRATHDGQVDRDDRRLRDRARPRRRLVSEGVEATVPPTVRELVEAVATQLRRSRLSIIRLANLLGLDKSATSRRWRNAQAPRLPEEPRGDEGQAGPDRARDPLPDDVEILPSPERLEERCGVAGESGDVAREREPDGGYELCLICGSPYELDDEHPERLRCEIARRHDNAARHVRATTTTTSPTSNARSSIGPVRALRSREAPDPQDAWGVDPCLVNYLSDVAHSCCGHGSSRTPTSSSRRGARRLRACAELPERIVLSGHEALDLLPGARGRAGGTGLTPAARDAVARVFLAQLRRAYPHVVWRLVGEDERLCSTRRPRPGSEQGEPRRATRCGGGGRRRRSSP